MGLLRGYCWNWDGSDTVPNNGFKLPLNAIVKGIVLSGRVVTQEVAVIDVTLAPSAESGPVGSNNCIARIEAMSASVDGAPFNSGIIPFNFPIDQGDSVYISAGSSAVGVATLLCEVPS